jgi:hypothetical protein
MVPFFVENIHIFFSLKLNAQKGLLQSHFVHIKFVCYPVVPIFVLRWYPDRNQHKKSETNTK